MLKESKGEDATYKSHSTQINLYDCSSEKDFNFILLQKQIPEEAIYREYPQVQEELFYGAMTVSSDDPRETYGLEICPHISVLYPIKDDAEYFDMRDKLKNFGRFEFEIGKVKSFRNIENPYDVLVVEAYSQRLKDLHSYMKYNFKNEFNFPEYVPHITLAYVKKDRLKELEGDCSWTGTKYSCNLIKFSHVDKYQLEIPLE